jgi:hypothetical protein
VKALIATLYLTAAALSAAPPEADRTAILSMAGTFDVTFRFTEDAALISGAKNVSKPYTEQALEVVVIAEDKPERITLQHLLIVSNPKTKEDSVIKHWAQVWTWQDTKTLDYAGSEGEDIWKHGQLSKEEAAGKWSQLVTSVDDTPRYEGVGKWKHSYGISTWTGTDTRRPLPRREYTKRDDYDYLYGSNTHTISPNGWLHFQDNLKVIDRGEAPLAIAHETGLNEYTRTTSPRAETATAWWKENHPAWDGIRSFWIKAIDESKTGFNYTSSHDGNGLSKTLATLTAEKPSAEEISKALTPYIITKN